MPAGYAFLPGDICTHNRFECRVESVDDPSGKIEISFAVFIDGNRTFDENDTKLVQPSRLKLVQRAWNESLLRSVEALSPRTPKEPSSARKSFGITPSFSERQKTLNDDSEKENRRSSVGRGRRRSSLTSRKKSLSPESSSSSSSSSSDYESSYLDSSGLSSVVDSSRFDESPIPIVPDSYEDSSYSVPGKKGRRKSAKTQKKKYSDESPIPIVPDSYDSSFSVKKKAKRKTRKKSLDDTPIPIVPDSFEDSFPVQKKKVKRRSSRKVRRKSIDDSPIPIVSDSFEDSLIVVSKRHRRSDDGADGERGSKKRTNKKNSNERRKSIARVSLDGDSPIPIVPDSYDFTDNEDSESFPISAVSVVSDSQDCDQMRSLARQYEERARKTYRNSDEVRFQWDAKNNKILLAVPTQRRNPSTASSFIVKDTPPIAPAALEPQRPKKSLDSLYEEFPDSELATTTVETIRRIWSFVDDLMVPVDITGIAKLIDFLAKASAVMGCQSNIAAELRMTFTHPSFGLKSMTGWIAAIATVALLVWRFKKQLFDDFIEKIAEKCNSRFELRVCFAIAILNVEVSQEHALCAPPAFREVLSQYCKQNLEGKDLIETLIFSVIKSRQSMPLLLPALGSILGSLAPPPMEVTESMNFKLGSEFAKKLASFLGSQLPNIQYLPLLVKGGGFLPPTDIGQLRVDFGKHRGMAFQHLIKDKGFCDWTERVSDPSSTSFVQWLDFILWHRQICVIGPRTIRGDVELIRMAGDKKIEEHTLLWLENRAIVCLRALDFFENIKPRTNVVTEHIAYTQCVYEVLRKVSDNPALQQLETLTRPRGEIIKEFFRPMIRLGTIVPSMKQRVANALIAVRARTHQCSLEEARTELISIHSLPL